MVYWASLQGGLYFALRWMHVGGFMALGGEMTALISQVRLRVSFSFPGGPLSLLGGSILYKNVL